VDLTSSSENGSDSESGTSESADSGLLGELHSWTSTHAINGGVVHVRGASDDEDGMEEAGAGAERAGFGGATGDMSMKASSSPVTWAALCIPTDDGAGARKSTPLTSASSRVGGHFHARARDSLDAPAPLVRRGARHGRHHLFVFFLRLHLGLGAPSACLFGAGAGIAWTGAGRGNESRNMTHGSAASTARLRAGALLLSETRATMCFRSAGDNAFPERGRRGGRLGHDRRTAGPTATQNA
jgi:hypothetical protein